jgi:PIN domain nuclease of toxin-antitoxin system
VKLCQVGNEQVKRVLEKNSISSSEIGEVSEKTLTELINILLAQQGVLE